MASRATIQLQHDHQQAHARTKGDVTDASHLSGDALRLLLTLEGHVELTNLSDQFPRVLNNIAAVWHQANQVDDLLKELLFDRRIGRRGFPYSVISELIKLFAHHHQLHPPSDVDPWD
jgi:hypothetical protein